MPVWTSSLDMPKTETQWAAVSFACGFTRHQLHALMLADDDLVRMSCQHGYDAVFLKNLL
jgi:hypothetical protein